MSCFSRPAVSTVQNAKSSKSYLLQRSKIFSVLVMVFAPPLDRHLVVRWRSLNAPTNPTAIPSSNLVSVGAIHGSMVSDEKPDKVQSKKGRWSSIDFYSRRPLPAWKRAISVFTTYTNGASAYDAWCPYSRERCQGWWQFCRHLQKRHIYIQTPHTMLIHADSSGFILNPSTVLLLGKIFAACDICYCGISPGSPNKSKNT